MCERDSSRGKSSECEGTSRRSVYVTLHLNLSPFTLRQIARVREVNKHVAWLDLAADVILLTAIWFMSFFLVVEKPEQVDEEV